MLELSEQFECCLEFKSERPMVRYMELFGYDVRKVCRMGNGQGITLPKSWITAPAYQLRLFKATDLEAEMVDGGILIKAKSFVELISRVKKLGDEIIVLVPVK